jgi:hypothetical protein
MASTYLTRTLGSGDTQRWTISFWTKKMMASGSLLSVGTSGNYDMIYFNGNKFAYYSATGGADDFFIYSEQVFRDSSAWYHIVLAIDTTQATSSNRAKLYVNGEQITTFDGSNVYPSQNFNVRINSSSQHNIGNRIYSSDFNFDGSMAHVHFTDGTAYDASTFGETDATTGIWKPKTAPSVTYGTNGFFLKFENSGAFGTDSSPNANNFTVNGTMTQTIDTPSNVFATLNPLNYNSQPILYKNGNTVGYSSVATWSTAFSTLAVSSGKYYFEAKSSTNNGFVGICKADETYPAQTAGIYLGNVSLGTASWGYYAQNGNYVHNGSFIAYGNSWTNNEIIGCALDLDNNKLYFSINGVWQNSGDPTSGATGTGAISITASTYFFGITKHDADSEMQTNFGNGFFGTTVVSSAENPDDGIGIFEYDVPTGYKALCTKSINAQEYS